MTELPRAFQRTASRRRHLDEGNLLRSLTLVINGVPGGINLGQGVCDLDTPSPLRQGAIACIDGGDRQLYTPYAGLPELRAAIARKLQRHNGLAYEAANVAVCTGRENLPSVSRCTRRADSPPTSCLQAHSCSTTPARTSST